MKLSIYSHWEGKTWSGEIPDRERVAEVERDLAVLEASGVVDLEYVFRYFNRVEPGDGVRLEAIGYVLPSLSVDDEVELDGRRWRCAGVGWVEVFELDVTCRHAGCRRLIAACGHGYCSDHQDDYWEAS